MIAARKRGNRAARACHPISPPFRRACDRSRSTRGLGRTLGLAVIAACCWTGLAAADDQVVPIKIAVFPFELEDFSAAREQGSSPVVTSYLEQSTEEARRQLLQSGRYRLIDTAGSETQAAKDQGLRNCGGCEAAAATALGADQALIGVVTKISMTEYIVRFQVSDARKGAVISGFSTDLRMGTSDSWFRGVRWLMKNRMLVSK